VRWLGIHLLLPGLWFARHSRFLACPSWRHKGPSSIIPGKTPRLHNAA
jgi:hypothetical protein